MQAGSGAMPLGAGVSSFTPASTLSADDCGALSQPSRRETRAGKIIIQPIFFTVFFVATLPLILPVERGVPLGILGLEFFSPGSEIVEGFMRNCICPLFSMNRIE
jgi:hypothetical protein